MKFKSEYETVLERMSDEEKKILGCDKDYDEVMQEAIDRFQRYIAKNCPEKKTEIMDLFADCIGKTGDAFLERGILTGCNIEAGLKEE